MGVGREVYAAALVVARRPAAAARLPVHLAATVADALVSADIDAWRLALQPPTPASLARLHPSWLAAAVADEPAHVRAAFVDQGWAPWARALVVRTLTAELVPMPPDGLAAAPSDALLTALDRLGAERVALALAAAPAAAHAHALAALGAAVAERVRVALPAAVAGPAEARSQAVRELGALIAQGAPQLGLRAAGRQLGPALDAQGDLARAVAQRLPRDAGLAFVAECGRSGVALADSAAALAALTQALHDAGHLADAERP